MRSTKENTMAIMAIGKNKTLGISLMDNCLDENTILSAKSYDLYGTSGCTLRFVDN